MGNLGSVEYPKKPKEAKYLDLDTLEVPKAPNLKAKKPHDVFKL